MSSTKHNYYDILQVNKSADLSTIKKSYRKLAHVYHPDKNPDNKQAEEKFKEICEAYSILSNPQKRKQYDQFGDAGLNTNGFNSSSVNINDIFGDIFGDIFSENKNTYNSPKKGKDIHYSLNIDFNESITGTIKKIEISRKDVCTRCYGSGAEAGSNPVTCMSCNGRGEVSAMKGFFAITQTCDKCNGTGKYINNKCINCNGNKLKNTTVVVQITIPKGIDHGMKIKVNNEGEHGIHGGDRGDLYVLIYVKNHTIFKRQGNDVLCDVPVLCTKAMLGCAVEIPTIYGKVEMNIPKGTQTGTIFRLKRKGFPSLRKGYQKGDQLVRIQIETPKNLNSKQIHLINNFNENICDKNNPDTLKFKEIVKELF